MSTQAFAARFYEDEAAMALADAAVEYVVGVCRASLGLRSRRAPQHVE